LDCLDLIWNIVNYHAEIEISSLFLLVMFAGSTVGNENTSRTTGIISYARNVCWSWKF